MNADALGERCPRCLVVSPIPTIPAEQGNAALIARLNRCLQEAGYAVHFVYSAMEGMDGDALAAMEREWEQVDVVPFSHVVSHTRRAEYALDDWLDPAVVAHVGSLCALWNFDLVLVHYVWMSGVFSAVPAGVPKWLYTHDRFGDRHLMLARAGIAPTWYSVAIDDEAQGLARADLVLATQENEACYFRTIVESPVHVLGLPQALRNKPPRRWGNPDALVAGYIGSTNPSNCRALGELLRAIDGGPLSAGGKFQLVTAGPISLLPEFSRPYVSALGRVQHPDDLFARVDVMVNPSVGGSGLKIKTVESLAAGMPLVSTRDGVQGLSSPHPALNCDGPTDVAKVLPLIMDKSALAVLASACRQLIESYQRTQRDALSALLSMLSVQAGRQ